MKAIDIAGRPDKNSQFVKSFKIYYTLNGVEWMGYNNEEQLDGNADTANVVRHELYEFEALSVRICPTEW